MTSVTLESGLSSVVGARTAKALERAFGMTTVEDLVLHYPRRYSRRGDLTPLNGLPRGEHITVVAQVLDVRERRMQRRRGSLLEARITDGTGYLTLTFFNQNWRLKDLRPGRRGMFSGKVSEYRGNLQLQHPDYELFENADEAPGAEQLSEAAARAWAETPVPIYPATGTVATWAVDKAVTLVLDALGPLDDPLPLEIRAAEGLMEFRRALQLIHKPKTMADARAARASLRFREAFELQLALLDRKRALSLVQTAPRPSEHEEGVGLLARFDAALPFALTGDQRRAGDEIANDLQRPHPMHRLLQGEVGSGKTLVALRAVLQVAESGGQSALLAPTEVLAGQHFRSIIETLGPDLAAELNPVLVTGKMTAAEKKRALLALAAGTAHFAVGTHALLSEHVKMYDLGLVIIDEQHRFGVDQRESLRRKGIHPHTLAMTATPIPRTVALTAFGDLEVTTIRELPAGRQGIETFVVPELEIPAREARVWARAREEVDAGRQVYVVCPAISATALDPDLATPDDAGEAGADGAPPAQLANVEDTLAWLRSRPEFATLRLEALDGSMHSDEKDRIMRDFAAGTIDLLVATTVIEVGVNVPNASLMIVRDADRFGVSQLHQLRGRVGRGSHAGLCLLITKAAQQTSARERIDAIAATTDGFALAEVDLEQRREGDVLGTAQSGGRSTLRLIRVIEDGELIAHARNVAATLLAEDPELTCAPLLADQLRRDRERGSFENIAKS